MKLREIIRVAKCSGLLLAPAVLINAATATPSVAAVRPTFVHSFAEMPDGAQPEGG